MNSCEHDCSKVEGKDCETESNWLHQVVTLIKSVADLDVLIVELCEDVRFLDHEFRSAKEVKCKSTFFDIGLVYLKW